MPDYNFSPGPGGYAVLNAGTASTSVALPAGSGGDLLIFTSSPTPAFVQVAQSVGTPATVATGTPVMLDLPAIIPRGDATHIAAITSSGTVALTVMVGRRRVVY